SVSLLKVPVSLVITRSRVAAVRVIQFRSRGCYCAVLLVLRFLLVAAAFAFDPVFVLGSLAALRPRLGFGPVVLRATAARMSSLTAVSLTTSPSPMSIARVARASKPALNKPCGSARDAPLKKFTFRWSRKAAMATTLPLYDQTGVFHFHSSP